MTRLSRETFSDSKLTSVISTKEDSFLNASPSNLKTRESKTNLFLASAFGLFLAGLVAILFGILIKNQLSIPEVINEATQGQSVLATPRFSFNWIITLIVGSITLISMFCVIVFVLKKRSALSFLPYVTFCGLMGVGVSLFSFALDTILIGVCFILGAALFLAISGLIAIYKRKFNGFFFVLYNVLISILISFAICFFAMFLNVGGDSAYRFFTMFFSSSILLALSVIFFIKYVSHLRSIDRKEKIQQELSQSSFAPTHFISAYIARLRLNTLFLNIRR